jgi:hypothetical protein
MPKSRVSSPSVVKASMYSTIATLALWRLGPFVKDNREKFSSASL